MVMQILAPSSACQSLDGRYTGNRWQRVQPSSLSISRIRSRSVTGPVCEIKAPGKAPGRAHVTCYGGRSPGERCADGERVDLPQFPEPGRVVIRGDLRVHRHHH
jgi:hypothetical protein